MFLELHKRQDVLLEGETSAVLISKTTNISNYFGVCKTCP